MYTLIIVTVIWLILDIPDRYLLQIYSLQIIFPFLTYDYTSINVTYLATRKKNTFCFPNREINRI